MRITPELVESLDLCPEGLAEFKCWLGTRQYVLHGTLATYPNKADLSWFVANVPGLVYTETFICGYVYVRAHQNTIAPRSAYCSGSGPRIRNTVTVTVSPLYSS